MKTVFTAEPQAQFLLRKYRFFSHTTALQFPVLALHLSDTAGTSVAFQIK